jgi:hypothetical protein
MGGVRTGARRRQVRSEGQVGDRDDAASRVATGPAVGPELLEHHSALRLPAPTDEVLAWFVREAWPSPATGTAYTEGLLGHGAGLTLRAESEHLVVFGDGIETDRLDVAWGQTVTVAQAPSRLQLVV